MHWTFRTHCGHGTTSTATHLSSPIGSTGQHKTSTKTTLQFQEKKNVQHHIAQKISHRFLTHCHWLGVSHFASRIARETSIDQWWKSDCHCGHHIDVFLVLWSLLAAFLSWPLCFFAQCLSPHQAFFSLYATPIKLAFHHCSVDSTELLPLEATRFQRTEMAAMWGSKRLCQSAKTSRDIWHYITNRYTITINTIHQQSVSDWWP